MDTLTRAKRRYDRAQAELEQARGELRAAVLEQLAAGTTQAQLVKATGWTRETLRQLARAAGQPSTHTQATQTPRSTQTRFLA